MTKMDIQGAQGMQLIFPASYLSSQLSMTGLLVVLGLGGKPHLAADVAIVQAAALALFYAFSGNARNLIFKPGQPASAPSLLAVRLVLMLPLGIGVYYLGSVLGGVAWDLALILILRKTVEWLSEIQLSEAERDQDAAFAWRHLILQSGLLIIAALWAISGTSGLMAVLTAWALVPLLMSFSYLQGALKGPRTTGIHVGMLLPHLGSTAVMGIGVYVFRLTLLLLVGKATAGDLFTAFAIGGILGSVFAAGLGPSLVLHEQQTGQKHMPSWLRDILILAVLSGLALTLMAYFAPGLSALSGKEPLFWQAVGLSLVGGVVMVLAQRQRLRDLQNGTEDDVFAPDVLANILIVAIVPFTFFTFGQDSLSWLYLCNAIVALIFYWMADSKRAEGIFGLAYADKLRAVLAVLLIFPIFVNLETGLFRSPLLNYESGGVLSKLPIPLSVIACYAGIALLGNYRQAKLGLGMIFGSFVLMVLSTVATAYNNPSEQQAKIILLVQYILPMFGLVLGMMYGGYQRNEYLVEKAILIVTAILVPAQLTATWVQGHMLLTPYLYLFSIYQHLQYVPVVVVCGYLVALYSLWDQPLWRRLIITLAPLLGFYAMASESLLAIGIVLAGCAAFLAYRTYLDGEKKNRVAKWVMGSLILVSTMAYYLTAHLLGDWIGGSNGTIINAEVLYETHKLTGTGMTNVLNRFDYWLFYLRNITSDPLTFIFGHSSPPDRKVFTSAHNYYLDYIYNYGVMAALVIIGMVIFTVIQLYRNRKLVFSTSSLVGLTLVVLFLLIPDSLLKVGMRQPYPGIITFFLWGLLLARMESLQSKHIRPISSTSVLP